MAASLRINPFKVHGARKLLRIRAPSKDLGRSSGHRGDRPVPGGTASCRLGKRDLREISPAAVPHHDRWWFSAPADPCVRTSRCDEHENQDDEQFHTMSVVTACSSVTTPSLRRNRHHMPVLVISLTRLLSISMISIRRFFWRPSAVSFDATGSYSALPDGTMRSGGMPTSCR